MLTPISGPPPCVPEKRKSKNQVTCHVTSDRAPDSVRDFAVNQARDFSQTFNYRLPQQRNLPPGWTCDRYASRGCLTLHKGGPRTDRLTWP